MSSRCTDTGGTESECAESSGRGGEGTAALEGNCRGAHPAAPRLCLPGVALLPEPGALLPYVSIKGLNVNICTNLANNREQLSGAISVGMSYIFIDFTGIIYVF